MESEVFDLLNAGPEHRFTVRGGPGQPALIVSNCTQAIARDVFGYHVVELAKAGYPALWTVHDELILEVPNEKAQEVFELGKKIMKQPPPEMPGLVLDCDGGIYDKYCKE